jgi:hypothetical protein
MVSSVSRCLRRIHLESPSVIAKDQKPGIPLQSANYLGMLGFPVFKPSIAY